MPAAAGIIIGVGGVKLKITDTFELGGIALGTIVVITGYHVAAGLRPAPTCKQQEPLLDAGTSALRRGRRSTDEPAEQGPRVRHARGFVGPAPAREAVPADASPASRRQRLACGPLPPIPGRRGAGADARPGRAAARRTDGVAVFNRVYLTVTEEIDRRIEAGTSRDRRAAAPSTCGSPSAI